MAKAIAKMPKLNDKKRIVVITQGDKPVVCVIGNFSFIKLTSNFIKENIKYYSKQCLILFRDFFLKIIL